MREKLDFVIRTIKGCETYEQLRRAESLANIFLKSSSNNQDAIMIINAFKSFDGINVLRGQKFKVCLRTNV